MNPIINDITQNLRLPGQYFDAETGYYHNGLRDYDPVIGRYLESDPIGIHGGLNTYGYAGQNPVRFTDPTGTAPQFGSDPTMPVSVYDIWASLNPKARQFLETRNQKGVEYTVSSPQVRESLTDLFIIGAGYTTGGLPGAYAADVLNTVRALGEADQDLQSGNRYQAGLEITNTVAGSLTRTLPGVPELINLSAAASTSYLYGFFEAP